MDFKFRKDMRHMGLDGSLADYKLLGNLAVRESAQQKCNDLFFASREVRVLQ
jgi:hypothetical protein